MDRILRQLRVGDMTLHAFHSELSAHRAPAAILDRVAGSLHRCRFAHDAPVQALAPRFQRFANLYRAIHGRTFFIAGQQESD